MADVPYNFDLIIKIKLCSAIAVSNAILMLCY